MIPKRNYPTVSNVRWMAALIRLVISATLGCWLLVDNKTLEFNTSLHNICPLPSETQIYRWSCGASVECGLWMPPQRPTLWCCSKVVVFFIITTPLWMAAAVLSILNNVVHCLRKFRPPVVWIRWVQTVGLSFFSPLTLDILYNIICDHSPRQKCSLLHTLLPTSTRKNNTPLLLPTRPNAVVRSEVKEDEVDECVMTALNASTCWGGAEFHTSNRDRERPKRCSQCHPVLFVTATGGGIKTTAESGNNLLGNPSRRWRINQQLEDVRRW